MILLMQREDVAEKFGGWRGFFETIDAKWLSDLQNFIHEALPKIVVIVLFAWLATRVVKLITTRVLKVAERHSGGMRSISQVRTLASVIRATGIGIIVFLALMEILPLLGFKLEPLLAGWCGRRGAGAGGADDSEGLPERRADSGGGPVQRGRRGEVGGAEAAPWKR